MDRPTTDPLRERRHREFAELSRDFTWRMAIVEVVGTGSFGPLAATNKFWADSYRVGRILLAIQQVALLQSSARSSERQ